MKRYKSTTILGGGPPGKIVQCQSFHKIKYIEKVYFHIYLLTFTNFTHSFELVLIKLRMFKSYKLKYLANKFDF